MDLSITLIAFIIIAATALIFFFSYLGRRKMKKSRYGHSFDFSRMPLSKTKDANGRWPRADKRP